MSWGSLGTLALNTAGPFIEDLAAKFFSDSPASGSSRDVEIPSVDTPVDTPDLSTKSAQLPQLDWLDSVRGKIGRLPGSTGRKRKRR